MNENRFGWVAAVGIGLIGLSCLVIALAGSYALLRSAPASAPVAYNAPISQSAPIAPTVVAVPTVQTVAQQPVVPTTAPAEVVPTTVLPMGKSAAQAVGDSGWTPYDSAGGIPYSGTTWAVDVAPDEMEVFTAGPACIAGVCLPGGTERGSVIILLPSTEVIHYEVTGVIAGSNWHGSYRPLGNPNDESTWVNLAYDRVYAMQKAPNCTPGKGCKVIDVLIVGPKGVVLQWTVGQ